MFDQAVLFGVEYLTNFQCQYFDQVYNAINKISNKSDHLYLTIDLDGMASSFAPGVSAPASIGLTPFQVIEMIRTIKKLGKLISMDIAEMNPRFDIDDRTAKLAAQLLREFI